MPASSRTSRRTASSMDSPWSMKPAKAEYMPVRTSGPCGCPNKQRSPARMSMMTTGSVRGKCSAPQAEQRRTWPPFSGAVAAPHWAQNRCRPCQPSCALAWATTPASSGGKRMAAMRQSSKRQPPPKPSCSMGSSWPETSTAKWATSSARPSSTGGAPLPAASASATETQPRPLPLSSTRRSENGRKRLAKSACARASQAPSRRCASARSKGLPLKV